MKAILDSKLEQLVRRVQAEYREMPGLCLTRRQAQRLLGLNDLNFTAVFQTLVASGFLCETHHGCFVSGNARDDDRHVVPPRSGDQSRKAGQDPGGLNPPGAVS